MAMTNRSVKQSKVSKLAQDAEALAEKRARQRARRERVAEQNRRIGAETDRMADEIEHTSPEGRPADPQLGPARITAMMLLGVVLVVGVGVVGSLMFDPAVGVVVGALCLLLLLINPETWASALRARERARAKHHIEDEDKAQRLGTGERATGDGASGDEVRPDAGALGDATRQRTGDGRGLG